VACQGQTQTGNPCPLPGEPDSGLCRHQHDPRWAEERSKRNTEAALHRTEPGPRVIKWGSTLAWPTPEKMVDSLAEAAGFVAAKAMTPNQGTTIAKLAETAAKVMGWPLPATPQAPTYNVVMTDYSAKKPAEASEQP
jgi:hypothetical protein